MQKIEDYRRRAAECRLNATRSASPEQRKMLLSMANAWDSLASNRLAKLAQQLPPLGLASADTASRGRGDKI